MLILVPGDVLLPSIHSASVRGLRPALAIVLAFSGSTPAGYLVGHGEAFAYPSDIDRVHADFWNDNVFDIRIGPNETLRIRGERADGAVGDGVGHWGEMQDNGSVILHRDRSVEVHGEVVGVDGSAATLLLGDHYMTGTIEVPSSPPEEFELNGTQNETSGGFDQVVIRHRWTGPW